MCVCVPCCQIPDVVCEEVYQMVCHAALNLRLRGRVPVADPAAKAVVAERTSVGVCQLEELMTMLRWW